MNAAKMACNALIVFIILAALILAISSNRKFCVCTSSDNSEKEEYAVESVTSKSPTQCSPNSDSVVDTFLNSTDKDQSDDSTESIQSIDNQPIAEAFRLPSAMSPEHYDLHMKVYLPGYGASIEKSEELTAECKVNITINVLETTNKIVLNSAVLNFTRESSSVSLKSKKNEKLSVSAVEFSTELEMVTILLNEELKLGDVVDLSIDYSFKIAENLRGLFLNKYKDEEGDEKFMIISQMEPTAARLVVPCFDEPDFKATWSVRIEHPNGTVALSNGLEKQTNLTDSWKLSTFAKTEKMSTYLLAIAVGNFSKKMMISENGILVRVWARHDVIQNGEYAIKAAAKVVTHFEKYFGIKYPLDKMDLLAAPDFQPGAMENWGLIIFKEKDFLYNENLYGMSEKVRVATLLSHEISHMWFGNLVTMKWWDDLWLNEGFATLMQYDGGNVFINSPTADTPILDLELVYEIEKAFVLDALPTSHPLSFKIDRPIEIKEAFDDISYKKGAAVLRMIRQVLGSEAFSDGLKEYFKRHSYGNARADDLWSALQVAATRHNVMGPRGKLLDVRHFASQWTSQMGFPIVIQSELNSTHIQFTQERYKANTEIKEKEKYRNPEFGFKWDIPLWIGNTRMNNDIKQLWLSRGESLILVKPKLGFHIINIDSMGFYRTYYDGKMLATVGQELYLQTNLHTTITRARFVSDAFAMALIGKLKYSELFEILRSTIPKETGSLPIRFFVAEIDKIIRIMGTDPIVLEVKKFERDLLLPLTNPLDKKLLENSYADDNKFDETQKAAAVTIGLCTADDETCLHKALDSFQNHFMTECEGSGLQASNCSTITPPLRHRFYCDGVKYSPPSAHETIIRLLLNETNQIEIAPLMHAATCTTDMALLKRTLLDCFDEKKSPIRAQEIAKLFEYAAENPVAVPVLRNFVTENWDVIYNRFKSSVTLTSGIVLHSTKMSAIEEIEQLKAWRASRKEALNLAAFDIAIANAYNVVEWKKNYADDLIQYFSETITA